MQNKPEIEKEDQLVRINPTVFLKVELNEPDNVIFVDNLVMTPLIKEKLLMPYLQALFDGLSLRSENPSNGVPRYAINEVSFQLTP